MRGQIQPVGELLDVQVGKIDLSLTISHCIPESYHATALWIGLTNTRAGGTTYMASFRQARHTMHSQDMLFAIGLHYAQMGDSPADRLMDLYYPKMVKRFMKTGRPDESE